MPATFNSLVPLIMWLSVHLSLAILIPQEAKHKKGHHTFTTRHANSSSLDLETKTSLVFPQGGRDTRLHARGGMLSRGVKRIMRRHSSLAAHPGEG